MSQINVLGDELQPCSYDPLTGYYRTGCCENHGDDPGMHVVCVVCTDDFLTFSASVGNDLSTPMPSFGFAGLRAGDQWCLCAARWQEAFDAGKAPQVVLAGTHVSALEYCSLKDLTAHAVDAAMSVHVDRRDAVWTVTIDRPEVRNAVDGPTAALLAEAFRTFDNDETASVAILTGANGTFCAGADLKAITDGRGNRVDRDMDVDGPMGPTRMLLSKPVIAAVEGFAVAGGLELALWCDLRIAADDAVFGVYCRRWGVPLIDGGTVRLPRLIGHSNALDLILTGRGVSGEEAQRMGLANRLAPKGGALAAATELATLLAALPQGCLRNDRRSSYEQWNMSLPDALSNETSLGLATIMSGETLEGAARFAAGAGRHGEST